MAKRINLYNIWHIGDAIFVMIYLYNCKDYIIKHDITVNFYIRPEHVHQVKEFECCKNVHVLPLGSDICKNIDVGKNFISEFMKQTSVSLNLCSLNLPYDSIDTFPGYYAAYNYFLKDFTFLKYDEYKKPLNDFYVEYYSNVLGKNIGFPKIKEFSYTDKDLLKRYSNFPQKYKGNEILIINSKPRSNQYDLEKHKKGFVAMIRELAKKYKVITTDKVAGIPCTRDGSLTLKDIAAISTHVKYVIAINTGPLTVCLNTYALSKVKAWFVFDTIMPFIYDNFYINKSFTEIINMIDMKN
jgi:hypothetical protein